MNIQYPAKITHDASDDRYLVQFYDFDEAITEGETLEEAIYNASEVLSLTIEGRFDEKMDVPEPSRHANAYMVAPAARVQAALLIHFMKGKRTNAEIARALGTSWPSISRLEDPRHWPSLRTLERAAAALGQKLILSMEPINKSQEKTKSGRHKHA